MTWLASLVVVPLFLVLSAVLWTERGRLTRVGFRRFAIEFEATSQRSVDALPRTDFDGLADGPRQSETAGCATGESLG
jgi:hypothetical protein